MYAFLEHYYQLTQSDEVGAMLGWMSMLEDGETADPAVWGEWLQAVQQAANADIDTQLRLDEQQ
jgi:hypothetical protein